MGARLSNAHVNLYGALRLVELGWSVFPVSPGGADYKTDPKKPLTEHGFKDATTDPAQVLAWAQQFPGCMFAVPTEGCLVVDLDVAKGDGVRDGAEWSEAAKLEEGIRSITTSGWPAQHRIFAQPPGEPRRNTVCKIAPGYAVDTRADGGYIVAPGQANAAGGRYVGQLPRRADLPVAPEWLLRVTGAPPAASKAQGTIETPRGRRNGLVALEPLRAGSRNDDLFSQARSWLAKEVGYDRALEWARQLQQQADTLDDPFTWEEAKRTFDSAYSKPAGLSPEYRARREIASQGQEPVEGEVQGRSPSTADQLVEGALRRFDIARADDNTPVAIPKDGGRHALPLRGEGGVRQLLAADHYEATRKSPTQSALADALGVLTGMSYDAPVIRTWTRVARTADDGIEIDLGDETGRGIRVTPTGWDVVARTTEAFTRTALTQAYPAPTRGGSVDSLFELINVNDEDKDQLVAWMVAALIPDIPHAVLLLAGEQGTGKSDCTEMLGSLLDPSKVPKRSAPRDENQWHVQVAGSWLPGLDNLSSIPHWLSDAICRVVTGDGDVRRQLYTDGDLIVRSIRRVVLINGIGLTALRGDLADRLMRVELQVIPRSARKEHKVLMDRFQALRPGVFGALLDLLSQVLAVQAAGGVTRDEWPRLADFARIVAAVDRIRGTNALGSFLQTQDDVTAQVAGDDPVTEALEEFLNSRNGAAWSGTATQLSKDLGRFAPHPTPKNWPGSAVSLAQRLAQLAPGLRARGVGVETWRKKSGRGWTISRGPRRDDPADPQQPLPGGRP